MDPKVLRRGTATFTVDLHPSRAGDALDGVRDHLNACLVRWHDGLKGILLAYSRESIAASEAIIHPIFPYLRVKVTADVLMFRPKGGQSMVGTVNKVGTDYIGLLVLGVFNVAIGRAHIREDLYFSDLDNCWLSQTDSAQRVVEGSDVRFFVDRLNTEGDYFSMTGSLMDPSTGCLPPQMEIQATCAPIITMPLATPPQADSATVGAVFASFTPKDRSRQDGSSGATAGCVELPNHGGGGSNPGAPVVSGRLFEPGPRNAMGSPCRGGGSGNAKAAGALDQRKRRSGEEEDGTERKKRKKQKLEAGVRGEASARDSLEGAVGGGGAMAEDALEGAGLKNSNKRSGKTSGAEGKTQQASVDRTNNVSRVVPQSSEVAADATPDLPERDRKGFASHAAGTGEARPSSLESGGWHGAATQSASWDSAHRKHKKKRTHDAGLSRGEGSKLGKAKGVGQRVDAGLLGELNHRQSGERKRKSKGN